VPSAAALQATESWRDIRLGTKKKVAKQTEASGEFKVLFYRTYSIWDASSILLVIVPPKIATEVGCICGETPAEIRYFTMRWLRLVGSLKLYVSFAKEPYKTDDILQKRLAAPYLTPYTQLN